VVCVILQDVLRVIGSSFRFNLENETIQML
jgi:hypothetical protein